MSVLLHCTGRIGVRGVLTVQSDIVLQTDKVIAFIAAHWWPNNPGHVLVAPVEHIENIYTLPNEIAAEIHQATRQVRWP